MATSFLGHHDSRAHPGIFKGTDLKAWHQEYRSRSVPGPSPKELRQETANCCLKQAREKNLTLSEVLRGLYAIGWCIYAIYAMLYLIYILVKYIAVMIAQALDARG